MGNRHMGGRIVLQRWLTTQACLAALLVAGGPLGARAQDEAQPARGTRVKLTLKAEARPLVGVLEKWTDASLSVTLSNGGGTTTVPRTEIFRLERQTGPSRQGRGALIGASILGGRPCPFSDAASAPPAASGLAPASSAFPPS